MRIRNSPIPSSVQRWAAWPWAPWGLAALLLALGFFAWEPFPPGIWNDDGVYVLLGRSLSNGDGLRYMGIPGAPLAPKFPPLYPLGLSLVWFLFPAFPENVPALAGFNLVATALASGCFAVYLRKVLKLSAPFAVSLTALFWLSGHLWRVASVPLSEPLFLLSLVLALWAGGIMEAKKGPGPLALFLLAGGFAVYTRTFGIAVLVAGFVSLLLAGRTRAAAGAALGTLALTVPWFAWSARAADTIPGPLLDTLGPYSGWLVSQVTDHPGEFASFVLGNTGQLLAQVNTLLVPGASGHPLLLGLLVAPLLLWGLWILSKKSRILPLSLLFSVGILLIWPFRDVRLLVPFLPVLGVSVAVALLGISRSSRVPKGFRVGASVLGLAWAVLFASVSIHRLSTGWGGEAYRIRSAALMDAVRAVDEKTPPDAVVGAPEFWAGIQLYTGRMVVPSARFRPLSGEGPVEGTPEEQYEIWIELGVTHILVEQGGRIHGAALDRVDALCPPGTLEVLDSQPGQFLVALNWDSSCQERVLAGG